MAPCCPKAVEYSKLLCAKSLQSRWHDRCRYARAWRRLAAEGWASIITKAKDLVGFSNCMHLLDLLCCQLLSRSFFGAQSVYELLHNFRIRHEGQLDGWLSFGRDLSCLWPSGRSSRSKWPVMSDEQPTMQDRASLSDLDQSLEQFQE